MAWSDFDPASSYAATPVSLTPEILTPEILTPEILPPMSTSPSRGYSFDPEWSDAELALYFSAGAFVAGATLATIRVALRRAARALRGRLAAPGPELVEVACGPDEAMNEDAPDIVIVVGDVVEPEAPRNPPVLAKPEAPPNPAFAEPESAPDQVIVLVETPPNKADHEFFNDPVSGGVEPAPQVVANNPVPGGVEPAPQIVVEDGRDFDIPDWDFSGDSESGSFLGGANRYPKLFDSQR